MYIVKFSPDNGTLSTKIRRGLHGVSNDGYAIFFLFFFFFFFFFSNLFKSICYGYSFESPRQVEAIQMSTHSICFISVPLNMLLESTG